MLNILGLNFGHDGAVAVLKGGKLVAAVSNERLSRQKKAEGITREMIAYVLDAAGLTLAQINGVAFGFFMYRPDNYIKIHDIQGREVTSDLLHLPGNQATAEYRVVIEQRVFQGAFVQHHICHAAAAFYTSPFERAACFTLDASFINEPEGNSLFSYGDGGKLHYLTCPGLMLGNAYSRFTEWLGIGPSLTKAGVTMALAEFGKPLAAALEKWEYFSRSFYARTTQFSDEIFIPLMWSEMTGQPPHVVFPKEKSDTPEAMNIAASIEYIFENGILQAAKELHAMTRSYNDGNLCLGGGSFLNCNANMLLKRSSGFKNVHLFPACGDDGTAAGAALYLAHHMAGVPRARYEPREYMYLGRGYSPPSGGEPYDARAVAAVLAEGGIVAFFQGGSEFGPRALGHRSLLADPRNPGMKDLINSKVKHREWFRPFAPVVLAEKAAEWFEIDFESKLMLFVVPIKRPEELPAVSHVDRSARLQTVERGDNPQLYELIEAFEALTGVPILLNTSLNDNSEPLVETPQDALNFLGKSDIALLVIGDRVYRKGK